LTVFRYWKEQIMENAVDGASDRSKSRKCFSWETCVGCYEKRMSNLPPTVVLKEPLLARQLGKLDRGTRRAPMIITP
jgi:hypothetical protein